MKRLKAVLFDHDGTLVDSEIIHYRLWKEVLTNYQINYTEDLYRAEGSGIPTLKNAELLISQYGLSMTSVALTGIKEKTTREYLKRDCFPLMPFTLDILKYLKEKDFIMGIVSGSNRFAVEATVNSHQLTDFFDILVTGDDVEHNKPHPEIYLKALKQLGINAEQCVAIEDTESGIQSATSAGITCCGVRNEYSKDHDFSQAACVVNNLDQTMKWISGLPGI
ncbi:MAG: HAD family phosphatase [Proteobacteria bacterium]|nr:HAD family phosphatase [Pseudomonadota bacterium]